jgi:DNA anti-recombination protein RmuC
MPNTNENERVENAARSAYDAVIEKRIAAVETDVAVIRNSFATKEDVQRILTLLYDQKLEFKTAEGALREDFHAAFARHREEWSAALAKQREEFNAALAKQKEEFNGALAKQREEFNAALAKQRDEFNVALAKQREYIDAALAQLRVDILAGQLDMQKTMMNHMWKLYGFASLVVGGVYYIARYVH